MDLIINIIQGITAGVFLGIVFLLVLGVCGGILWILRDITIFIWLMLRKNNSHRKS